MDANSPTKKEELRSGQSFMKISFPNLSYLGSTKTLSICILNGLFDTWKAAPVMCHGKCQYNSDETNILLSCKVDKPLTFINSLIFC